MRFLIIPIALLVGCDADPTAPVGPQTPVLEDTWTHANPTDKGPAVLNPAEEASGKDARRMSVEQLAASVPRLFGGETWTVPFGGDGGGANQVPAFLLLGRTLGAANYIQVNEANLEPSPLFAKYMDDMAGDVCSKAITQDLSGTGTEKLVMVEEDVDDNLRFLRLKLHGIYVAPGSTDGIEDLRTLYDGIAADADENFAWFGVCVAMLTAPEFMAY